MPFCSWLSGSMGLEQPVSQDRDCLWRNTRKKLNFLEFSECWSDLRDAYWALHVNVVVQSPIVSYSLRLRGLGQVPLSFTVSQSLFKFMSIESVILFKHLIFCLPHSPFAFNFSQHQGLFQRVSSLHQVARVLEVQLQHQSFQWIIRVDFC